MAEERQHLASNSDEQDARLAVGDRGHQHDEYIEDRSRNFDRRDDIENKNTGGESDNADQRDNDAGVGVVEKRLFHPSRRRHGLVQLTGRRSSRVP